MVGEFSFLFDGALTWACAGTVVALALPAPALLAHVAGTKRAFFQAAIGFGLGWWGGLPWSFAFALTARAYRPPPPVPMLSRITWLAVAAFAAVALVAPAAGLGIALSLGGGVIAATLTARFGLWFAAGRQRA
jgi:hypothetical protein